MLADISSEMIHSLLPVFMVTVLGASALTVGLVEGVAEATALIVKVFSGTLSDYLGRRKMLAVDLLLGARVGVEVLEGAGLDAGRLDEGLDIVGLQSDHPPEPVGRQVAEVDEPVEGSWRDPEATSRVLRRQPGDVRCHARILPRIVHFLG